MILNGFFKVTPEKRKVKIRNRRGVLYNNPKWWKKIIFYFGSILVIISLFFILYIYEPIMISWIKYKLIDQSTILAKVEEIKSNNLSLPTPTVKESLEVIKNTPEVTPTPIVVSNEFKISIPKIGAEADIQAGVPTDDKEEYMRVLKNNVVAQALSTGLPGEGNGRSMFLFAHSSEQGVFDARDNPVFYLLGKLENNDDILINYRGKIFTYKVYTKKVIGAKESDYLNYSENDKEVLILQTCWPIGTNWQRLLVFAERI
jgi:LPXTG-site transpeptidase (sortase) family protein